MADSAFELLSMAFREGTCLRLVISQRSPASDVEFSKFVVRPVTISGRVLWQFTYHFPKKVTHENLDTKSALARLSELFPAKFVQGTLSTPEADIALHARADGTFRTSTSPPTRTANPATHDRSKAYLIPEGVPCPFLAEIGVMTPAGQVRRAMYHKFRQINRFLELVEDVVPALPEDREVRVVDFGCGKSYLTFALHHLLTVIHKRSVRITGLDRQPEVIRTCAALAKKLDCAGLQFREGDISGYAASEKIDLAVSLHACDTATDAALAQAVRWECAVILAVPCCQHEFAPRIHVEGFEPLTRHGILQERFAALATDAVRGALLEIHGYATQVVEFIDMEHTPKNLLIRAVRRNQHDPELTAARQSEYRRYLAALGLETCFLERALEGLQK